MDEQLRKLERSYRQGLFGKEEIQNLRGRYVSTFGFCPPWFAIQNIEDYIQEYITGSYNHHLSTRESMDALLADYALLGIPTVAQVLEEDRPYRLQISSNVGEKIVNDLPMIVAALVLRIGFQWNSPEHRSRWEEIRNRSADWLRTMIASTLEQCGYYACASVDKSRISDDMLVVTGAGYPLNLVEPPPISTEFREMYRTWIPSRGPASSVQVVMSVAIDTINLIGRRSAIRNSYNDVRLVIPGSLRDWLLEGNPGGTNRGSIYYGHLVLARVPNDMFLDWSGNRARADQELTRAFEAGVETLPEMIFFVDSQEKTIYIVPTPVDYFKACYYLPLIADF